MEIESSRLTL